MSNAIRTTAPRPNAYLLGFLAALWLVVQVATVAHAADTMAHGGDTTCHLCQHHERVGAGPDTAAPPTAAWRIVHIVPFDLPDFAADTNRAQPPPSRAPPTTCC